MQPKPSRTPWVDYLRGFITLLVVAHHSSLAYTTFASFNKDAYILSTHPVVDTVRWKGLDIFEDFNDIFFMSLMFLISGIFMMQSLGKKGVVMFIRDRFYRLFIPFIIGVTILMLLAYFPAYYLAHGNSDIGAYIVDFFTVEAWPVGPPWFIWMLFVFNLVFALAYPFIRQLVKSAERPLNFLKKRPALILPAWYAVTWILYMPLLLWFEPGEWTGIGPFDFQQSRVLLYFGYFILGILIGSSSLKNSLFSEDSPFVKKWLVWLIACLLIYALLKLSETPLREMTEQKELTSTQARLIYRSIWTLSCTLSCIAFLTLFKRLFQYSKPWWESLSAHAYGIYLVHYIFVTWCQYFLLGLNLSAVVKFLITFILSLALSWYLVYLIRKVKIVGKYL